MGTEERPSSIARKLEIRWPTAAVLIVAIATVGLVYAFVPEHRAEIGLGVAGVFTIVLAFMRRVLGLAPPALVLLLAAAIAIPVPGCGSVIGTQARIATAGLVTVEGIQRFADTNHESAIAACASAADRIACIDAADAEWIPVGEGADGAGMAIVGWIGTLEVARLADGDIDEALSMAMARALDVIRPAFVLALCRDAPIPPWLLQAIGIDPETACEEG